MANQTVRSIEPVEFTYDWYRLFLDLLREKGYQFQPFTDRINEGDLILRHDVDLSCEDALKMAQIEADRDVQSTFFVLLTSSLYNLFDQKRREQLQEIESLGHDIGLHFSTHDYWSSDNPPDTAELEHRVTEELVILNSLLSTSTEFVSFHAPPSWVLDKSFNEFQSTYAPKYFSEIVYVADSGQRWRDIPPSIEDHVTPKQLLSHPGLWGDVDRSFRDRVTRAIAGTCAHANKNARHEFIQGELK